MSRGRDATLEPTWFMDFDQAPVRCYAEDVCAGCSSDRERAVRLFYSVRDDIRYDPYRVSRDPAHLKASTVVADRVGYCVPKAVLLAACARALGIPARLGFADVKNHLTTPKLKEQMGTDLFVYHGFTELFLSGRWVKATPTFNRSLCDRFGVKTLEFDGENDALLQPYDREGSQHMEYMKDRGSFDDMPWDQLIAAWAAVYPRMYGQAGTGGGGAASQGDDLW